MATTGSGYVRPAMPMPADALPNHCLPQPSILRRASASPFASPLSSPTADRKGSYAFPTSLAPLDVTGLDPHAAGSATGATAIAPDTAAAGPSSLPGSPTDTTHALPNAGTEDGHTANGEPHTATLPALGRRESAIHFAPLPELSEEDRARRGSVASVGVASRSSMLTAQNGGAPKKVPRVNSVSNSDWAAYKRGSVDSVLSHNRYALPHAPPALEPGAANGSDADSTPDVVDQLASGVKSLWKRVRSSEASSKSSQDAAAAATAAAHVNAAARMADRRGSAPVFAHHKPGTPFHHNPSPLHAIPDNSANPSRVPSPPLPSEQGQGQKAHHQVPPMMALPGGTLLSGAPQVQPRDESALANRRVSAPVFSQNTWNNQRKSSGDSFTSPTAPGTGRGVGSPVLWREGVFDGNSPSRGIEHLSLAEEDEEEDGEDDERDEVEDQVRSPRPATPPRSTKKHSEDEGKEIAFEEKVTVKTD